MEERHIEILRKARAKLVKDLNVADILNHLPERIFTERNEEEIKAEGRNRYKQTEIFLDILLRRGPRAYYAFKEALRRPYPHLFDVLEKEEEFDRERISTAKTMRELRAELEEKTEQMARITEEFDRISIAKTTRDLRAELQEKTEENKKLFEERKDLRRQLEQMARITEDLNQERENSARLALECQDLKAKLVKEKEESQKIVDERDELRKQLEEKGKTRKTTDKPMEGNRRSILITAREYLVRDMNVEEVLIKMPHVFTPGEEEKIKSMPTQQQKCCMFLDTLPKRGNNAYDLFKKALKEVSPHLISTLDQADTAFP